MPMNLNTITWGLLAYLTEDEQGGLSVLILFGLIIAAVYFIPAGVAFSNGHPHALVIAVANTLFGWTLLVWIVALVWACHKPRPPVVINQVAAGPPPVPPRPTLERELEHLEALRSRQLVSDEEYQARRRKLLETI
jgi:Superinfection immunity protein